MKRLGYKNNNKRFWQLWVWLWLCTLPLPVMAAPLPTPTQNWTELAVDEEKSLSVPLYKSTIIQFGEAISKISIGNPDIADLVIINPTQMYILGKALGTTNVLVLDKQNQLLASINLDVGHDLVALNRKLQDILPGELIEATSSQGSIVLNGEVTSVTKIKTAVDLARTYLPLSKGLANTQGDQKLEGNGIVNLLSVMGTQQVMLEVKVAEISRQFLKSIDVNFSLLGPGGKFRLGAVSGGASLASLSGSLSPANLAQLQSGQVMPNNGILANYIDQNLLFNSVLNIAKEKGLAKILSEPTLTTLSGKEARFISGGEFPTPVPQSDGNVGVVFKEFGVALKFLPVVLDPDRINLELDLSVSELSSAHSMTVNQSNTSSQLVIPSLTKRTVQTTVELADGQTLGIAGLISDNLRSSASYFPGLEDIPVIGLLFRSQAFVKGQTELVIFVTPHFAVPPVNTHQRLPTDTYQEPTDQEFYLEGKLEGGKPARAAKATQAAPAVPKSMPAPKPAQKKPLAVRLQVVEPDQPVSSLFSGGGEP